MAIIEDNVKIRTVLADYFSEQPGYRLEIIACSSEDFTDRWKNQVLNVVLCDIGLPGKSGIETAWIIKQRSPQTQVVMLTVFEDKEKVFGSLCSGASGYLMKDTPLPQIRSGLDEIMRGGSVMSPQIARQVFSFFSAPAKVKSLQKTLSAKEIEIIALVQEGLSNKEIANRIFLTVDAIKYHIKNIYLKLQITSREELIRIYARPI